MGVVLQFPPQPLRARLLDLLHLIQGHADNAGVDIMELTPLMRDGELLDWIRVQTRRLPAADQDYVRIMARAFFTELDAKYADAKSGGA